MAEREMRKLVWEGNYTNLRIVRREGISSGSYCYFYSAWVRGDKESELPIRISNVKYTQNNVTVFDFMGNIYCGRGSGSKLILKIYEYPNGVVQAEIDVVPEDKS